MRAIGLDVHRDFCEVAVVEEGEVTSAGRIETTPAALELFAESLGPADRVALEVTGNAWEIARIIEPHVERVLVVSPSDTGIRQARAKTDCLDARSSRTRAKKEIHACLIRRLVTRPKVSDLFGIAGRQWLRELEHLEAGLSSARHALVEASWSAVRQPDPLRAFYERIRARRGHQVAVVAASRKLACLFWCLLTCRRSEEQGRARDLVDERRDQAGRAGARAQGEQAHKRTVADWQASAARRAGADATPKRASQPI